LLVEFDDSGLGIGFQLRMTALYRRFKISRLLFVKGGLLQRGFQACLARKLGVSRATICRDVKALLREGHPCPCCGAYLKPPPESSMFEVEESPDIQDERTLPSTIPREAALEDVLGFFHELSRRHTTCATFRRLTRYTVKAFQEQRP
jgi:hypothetical protein